MGENIIKNLLNCPSLPPFHFHCTPSLVEQQCSHPHPARVEAPTVAENPAAVADDQWAKIRLQPAHSSAFGSHKRGDATAQSHTHTRSRLLFFSPSPFFLSFFRSSSFGFGFAKQIKTGGLTIRPAVSKDLSCSSQERLEEQITD